MSQVSGTVTDPSGAAVPGAAVTMANVDTGGTRTVQSGADGAYIITNLPVGRYELRATKQGFAAYKRTGIVLQVNTNPQLNVTLSLGTESQTVEVQADAAMVETHDNGVGQVIEQKQVVDLPLNGRNVTQLVTLSGAAVDATTNPVPNAGQVLISNKNYPGASAFSIAGSQPGETLFALDGAPHMDPLSGVGLPMPFPDAVQEFKVETSSLPANYGNQPGGVVNVVTRSGTNTFHGSAFEFLRNSSLNARNYFAKSSDGLKRNQFGGTFGGPLVKNKLFIFGGYQGTRESISPAANIAYVATPAVLNGDFSGIESAACNNGTAKTLKAPFTGNQINPASFNPVALKVLALLPVSNDTCGKVTYTIPGHDHENQEVVRADWQKSQRHSIFAHYFITSYLHPPFYNGNLLTLSTDPSSGLSDRVQSITLGDTLALTSNTVNTFHIAYSRSAVMRFTPSAVPTLGALGANVYTPVPGWLNLNVSGRFNVLCTNCSPSAFASNDYQLTDDFTWIHGRHELQFGGSWIHYRLNGVGNFQKNGTFSFSGQVTGNALADFMLGNVSSSLQSNGQVLHERLNSPSLYAQDNIRISNQLKLNLGLRWDPFLLPYNADHEASIYNPAWFAAGVHSTVFPNAPVGTLFYGDPGMPGASYGYGKEKNFAPRVGIVFDPRGKGMETLRAGYGIYDSTVPLFLQVGTHTPWANPISQSQPAGGLSNPYATYPGGNPFPTQPPSASSTFPRFGGGLGNFDLHSNPMYIEQWNLSFEKQLRGNWMVSATYLGNRTVHLLMSEVLNPVAYVAGNCAAGQYGLTKPGPCSTAANENYRRQNILANPSQGQYYAAVNNFGYMGNASYNGLLLSAQHRFSHNFSVLTNYTWSHCLTESEIGLNSGATPQDPSNIRADYGNCLSDRRHMFNASAVLQTPQFASSWVQKLAGGWQFAPIITAQTGGWSTVVTGVDSSLMGLPTRPNLAANASIANPTIQKWFNTAAFIAPGPGQFGSVGRGTIEGPSVWYFDAALSRSFTFAERHTILFRFEAFNALNHPRFTSPNTAMNSATFGQITSALDPRILQLALKYSF